ncbi:hypothetical protein UPYG_G00214230 [Umbra pygmaea]|uniref:Uncharacterized protein n=1 Tax=Umbra pygmaea TaxID=75934 RepID=A0ABD0X4J1_UMBPY
MDSMRDQPNGGSKGSLRPCAPKSLLLRCLVGLPTVLCLMLSVSSIAMCLLMSFKTYRLESRLHVLEMEKNTVFNPPESIFTREDGTVLPALRSSFETLLQERLSQVIPKLRTVRDTPQECSCPPGTIYLFHSLTFKINVSMHRAHSVHIHNTLRYSHSLDLFTQVCL